MQKSNFLCKHKIFHSQCSGDSGKGCVCVWVCGKKKEMMV